jgi:VanZ family protein
MIDGRTLPRLLRGPVTTARREPILRCVPALLYLVAIHVVSSVPGSDMPSIVDDRIAHFLEYFGLAVLLHFAVSGFDRLGRPWTVTATVVLFAAVYGAADEFHQSFVPGRDASLKDLAFDVAGASAAALLLRWFAWRNVTR